jgi:hypothetical protein
MMARRAVKEALSRAAVTTAAATETMECCHPCMTRRIGVGEVVLVVQLTSRRACARRVPNTWESAE